MSDIATLNPYDPQALGNVALAAITALAQAKCKTLNLTKLLCDMPEAEHCRTAIKAAMDAGCPHDHLRNLMKAAFGGDLAGQSNTTVGQAALFPAMEPELAMAGAPEIPNHEEGLERSIAKAQTICCASRPIEKAQVGAYTRTHLGKVIQVHEYATRRQNSMNATKQAHATSDEALKSRTPEAHQKAVAGHMEALRHHTEAHELSPADVAGDHKELMDHHRAAARWHSEKAKGATAAYGAEKVEARGQERPAAKAHHEASTRMVNGKVVQVAAYDDKRQSTPRHWEKPHIKAAEELSAKAHAATQKANNTGTTEDHKEAKNHHVAAATAHAQNLKRAESKTEREEANAAAEHHGRWADIHTNRAEDRRNPSKN